MKAWSKILGPDERAEVEAAVVDAFVDPETGGARPTGQAKYEFVENVRAAQRGGRPWADIMLEEWAETGAGNFAVQLWKRRDAFTATAQGVQRTRALRRGRRVRNDEGASTWTQDSLLRWDLEALQSELLAEVARGRESRINVDTYGALIRLLNATEAETVGEALASIGKTLDEYLEAEAQAS
jgi:hypothetical protein